MSANKLTDQQKETLERFRKELEDDGLLPDGDSIGTDDATLLRFLRARKFNLAQTKKMFADCQKWRHTVAKDGIDELYHRLDPFAYPERPTVFKYWPMGNHKTDKSGRPINIQHLGQINLTELYKSVTPEFHWDTICASVDGMTREILPVCTQRKGDVIDNHLCIIDLEGYSLSQFWSMKHLIRDSFQVSQDCFPEVLGTLIVINAPSSITMIWNVVKAWLAKETIEKVEIMGTNYKPRLLELVDPANLPKRLGGECTCEGLGGCTISNAGPWMEGREERRKEFVERRTQAMVPGGPGTPSKSLETPAPLPGVETVNGDGAVEQKIEPVPES